MAGLPAVWQQRREICTQGRSTHERHKLTGWAKVGPRGHDQVSTHLLEHRLSGAQPGSSPAALLQTWLAPKA